MWSREEPSQARGRVGGENILSVASWMESGGVQRAPSVKETRDAPHPHPQKTERKAVSQPWKPPAFPSRPQRRPRPRSNQSKTWADPPPAPPTLPGPGPESLSCDADGRKGQKGRVAGAGRRGRQGRKVPPTEFQINFDLCIVYMLILRRVHSVSWVSVRICEQGGRVLSPSGQKGRRVAGRRRPSLFSSRPEPRAAREG